MQDFHDGEYVDRELVLVKVAVDSKSRAEVMQSRIFSAPRSWTCSPRSLTIEITGDESKVEKFLDLMKYLRRARPDAHRQGRVAEEVKFAD